MDYRVVAVRRMIEEAPGQRWPVRTLAHECRLSENRLRTLFRRDCGVTVHQFVKAARLTHGADLLGSTHLSIKEIAGLLNQHPSRFTKDFTNMFGQPPTAFRLTTRDPLYSSAKRKTGSAIE
jgi:transcriptional regulator GlxA family with amidase domain